MVAKCEWENVTFSLPDNILGLRCKKHLTLRSAVISEQVPMTEDRKEQLYKRCTKEELGK